MGEDRVELLREKLASRLDGEGNLQVVSNEHREQGRNLEAAHRRLEALIREALTPQKKRHPTRPSRASKERRLTAKKLRGNIKRNRQDPSD
jgi:ribosome-associated protein